MGMCVVPYAPLIVLTAYYTNNSMVYAYGTMHRLQTNHRPLQYCSAPIFVAWTHAWLTRLSDCFSMYPCMNKNLFLYNALGLWIVLWCLCVMARAFSAGRFDLCMRLLVEGCVLILFPVLCMLCTVCGLWSGGGCASFLCHVVGRSIVL